MTVVNFKANAMIRTSIFWEQRTYLTDSSALTHITKWSYTLNCIIYTSNKHNIRHHFQHIHYNITFLFHVTHKINRKRLNPPPASQPTFTKWRRNSSTAPGDHQNMALASRRVEQGYHYKQIPSILYK